MGFIRSLGKGLGVVTGTVVGGSIKILGEVTNIDFIKEVGDGVTKSSTIVGDRLGRATEGIVDLGVGAATRDTDKMNQGLNDVGGAVTDTLKGIGRGINSTLQSGADVVEGLVTKDYQKAAQGARSLGKTAAIMAVSITPIDFALDGLDALDVPDISGQEIADTDIPDVSSPDIPDTHDHQLVDNPNAHHVTPYWRHDANGNLVWVDGIDDPTVHGTDGWDQHNPDYRKPIED